MKWVGITAAVGMAAVGMAAVGMAAVGMAAIGLMPVMAQPVCKTGYVWREAFSGDTVCVPPARRQQVAQENAAAALRRSPDGGAYGPNTCRPGFVWRAARPSDLVCVTPAARDLAAQENTEAPQHVAAAAAPSPAPVPAPAAPAYKLSDWSGWGRADGADYRYRFGWNPKAANFPAMIDAIFEIRNRTSGAWPGSARAVDCKSDVLGVGSKSVTLRTGATQTVTFATVNCGTASHPFFKPSVVRSSTY